MMLALLLSLAASADPAAPPAAAPPADAPVPLAKLAFPQGTPVTEVVAALAAHPEGVALKLSWGKRSWTADELEALLHKSPEARHIRELDVSGNRDVGPAGVMAIAASPHLGQLRVLDVQGCKIGEAGARGLVYSGGLDMLERLVIDAKDPGPKAYAELEKHFGPRLVAN